MILGKQNIKLQIKMKLGDTVTSTKYPDRVFKLVWYKEGDATCAVQDETLRAVVKVSSLSLATPK